MKRFASKLFSKLVLGALIIILQFGWFVYLIYCATTVNSAVNIGFQVIAVALTLYVAIVDDEQKADRFLIQACSADRVIKSYSISVDKENSNEKSVCVL